MRNELSSHQILAWIKNRDSERLTPPPATSSESVTGIKTEPQKPLSDKLFYYIVRILDALNKQTVVR